MTGFLVSITETVVYHILFLTLYNHLFKNSWIVILIPMVGVLMTRVILLQGGIDGMGGTEEVVKSYHEFRGKIRLSSVLYKIPAYICTLGFGGSAGMEGISTYIGGAVSSLSSKILGLLNITAEDQRVLLLAGAGAGLSAMFKAPLTGAIFMLQVPFRGGSRTECLVTNSGCLCRILSGNGLCQGN
ncbi:Chloride channel, voltage gated, partial [mine drainage metagenome]